MSNITIEWEKASQAEKQAKEIEAENYRLLMLELKALQSGQGAQPCMDIFQKWKTSMQARLHHSSFRVALAKVKP